MKSLKVFGFMILVLAGFAAQLSVAGPLETSNTNREQPCYVCEPGVNLHLYDTDEQKSAEGSSGTQNTAEKAEN